MKTKKEVVLYIPSENTITVISAIPERAVLKSKSGTPIDIKFAGVRTKMFGHLIWLGVL